MWSLDRLKKEVTSMYLVAATVCNEMVSQRGFSTVGSPCTMDRIFQQRSDPGIFAFDQTLLERRPTLCTDYLIGNDSYIVL